MMDTPQYLTTLRSITLLHYLNNLSRGRFGLSSKLNGTNRSFIGRVAHKNRLINALTSDHGGTILIAGDRGAGKTTLLSRSLESTSAAVPKGLRWWQKSWLPYRKVVIDVPLIPGDLAAEEIRGVVLRAIVHSMHSEAWFSKWRTFTGRPIGYLWDLHRIRKQTKYKAITEKTGIKVGVGTGQLDSILNRVVEAELDLSAISLELYLREIFQRNSRLLSFIVVFDEMDKFESQVNPGQIVKELKNLFTLSGAHFVFTSTEDYYRSLLDNAENSPESTLFTHKILVNQLSPEDFRELEKDLVPGIERSPELQQVLMWDANLYPFALISKLRDLATHDGQGGAVISTSMLRSDGHEGWDYRGSAHSLITYIYNQYKNQSDNYFNRYLYRALKLAALKLYEYQNIKLSRNNLLAILFIGENDAFTTSTGRTSYYEKDYSILNVPPLNNENDWRARLFKLTFVEVNRISAAVTDLIVYFDRFEALRVDKVEKGEIKITELGTMTFSKVEGPLPNLWLSTSQERSNLRTLQLIQKRISHGIHNKTVATPELTSISYDEGPLVLSALQPHPSLTRRFKDDILRDRDLIGSLQESVDEILLQELAAELRQQFTIRRKTLADVQAPYVCIAGKEGKDIIIFYEAEVRTVEKLDLSGGDKYRIVNLTKNVKNKAMSAHAVTQIYITESWSNSETVKTKIKQYVQMHAAAKA